MLGEKFYYIDMVVDCFDIVRCCDGIFGSDGEEEIYSGIFGFLVIFFLFEEMVDVFEDYLCY